MREAFRRPTGDGVLDHPREFLAFALVLCRNSLPESAGIGSRTPPLGSPDPAHSAGPTPKPANQWLFRLQNRIQNFTRFLKAFWLPKWCQKPSKMMPKFIKNACFFQVCFHTVFSSILERFLIAFPGARPSISLLFTMNSWGAPFFAKSEKVAKMTSQSEPKCLPKCLQKPSKIDQKTKPKNNTKNHRIWLPK